MKTKSLFKNLFTGAAVLAVSVFISSCSKNDVDDSGTASIKVVNASPTSTPQGFYLANKTIVQSGLAFGNEKDYVITNSGNNLELQFRNDGSATAYATGTFNVDRGKTYTVFLAGDGQSARVKLYEDDLTAPASGQAKVRFVHLSDAAPASIDIRNAGGTNIVANLGRDNASSFVAMAPGILSLQVYGAGQTTNLGNFDITTLAAGKIYTVYVAGSTAGNISVQKITHN
ncbi:protein of unknown function [Pedobacter westerhofensis]|uniref:DUF4397 domain-containing protein n=1 Tax=Pedobacter westerhofensis TaxID=425512 RepID=A0A521FQA0_9SPHI|nr:DUF4397 domain-containing protein [Pedobacter westerhofensis]SMO97641.1 protein of unknown function [Pedobacter westerhofensis]